MLVYFVYMFTLDRDDGMAIALLKIDSVLASQGNIVLILVIAIVSCLICRYGSCGIVNSLVFLIHHFCTVMRQLARRAFDEDSEEDLSSVSVIGFCILVQSPFNVTLAKPRNLHSSKV